MKRRLEVSDPSEIGVSGGGDQLDFLLSPVNSPAVNRRIGEERIIASDSVRTDGLNGRLEITAGRKFRMNIEDRPSFSVGGRYLYSEKGVILGGLNYTKRPRKAVLSNIFVAENSRRRGIASMLVEKALEDMPELKADTCMTVEGAKFLGYDEYIPDAEVSDDRRSP